MDVRCILCDTIIEAVEIAALPPERPDVVCVRCHALPAEERRLLREQAMVRLLRQETRRSGENDGHEGAADRMTDTKAQRRE